MYKSFKMLYTALNTMCNDDNMYTFEVFDSLCSAYETLYAIAERAKLIDDNQSRNISAMLADLLYTVEQQEEKLNTYNYGK